MSRRVAVVGGGLAGITVALRCVDAGMSVTLLEGTPRLGGLTHSFHRRGLSVDNGQHVFLRCCTAYRALLDRLGVSDLVTVQPRLDIPIRAVGRPPARLRRSALPAPLHLAGALLTYRLLTPSQRWGAIRAALALRRVDADDPVTDGQSFGRWLAAHGQNRHATAALWDLLCVATLNTPPDRASLALAAMVVQTGLLRSSAAGDVGWATVPLQQLHGDAARDRLQEVGANVYTGARVRELTRDGDGWLLTLRSGAQLAADDVVLAVPPGPAESLLPTGALPQPAGWSQALGGAPIVNVHVVLDCQVLDTPFVAAVDSPVQWVFDRTAAAGLATGQYLAMSLSAAAHVVDRPAAELRAELLPALSALLPTFRKARVLDFFVTRERAATFDQAPGTAAYRPAPGAVAPGLALAGAWTATGWPATMEGAVRSGLLAAAAVVGAPADERRPAEARA